MPKTTRRFRVTRQIVPLDKPKNLWYIRRNTNDIWEVYQLRALRQCNNYWYTESTEQNGWTSRVAKRDEDVFESYVRALAHYRGLLEARLFSLKQDVEFEELRLKECKAILNKTYVKECLGKE